MKRTRSFDASTMSAAAEQFVIKRMSKVRHAAPPSTLVKLEEVACSCGCICRCTCREMVKRCAGGVVEKILVHTNLGILDIPGSYPYEILMQRHGREGALLRSDALKMSAGERSRVGPPGDDVVAWTTWCENLMTYDRFAKLAEGVRWERRERREQERRERQGFLQLRRVNTSCELRLKPNSKAPVAPGTPPGALPRGGGTTMPTEHVLRRRVDSRLRQLDRTMCPLLDNVTNEEAFAILMWDLAHLDDSAILPPLDPLLDPYMM